MTEQTKLSVYINEQTEMALREMASKPEVGNVTEAFRRLANIGALIEEELAQGKDLLLRQRLTRRPKSWCNWLRNALFHDDRIIFRY